MPLKKTRKGASKKTRAKNRSYNIAELKRSGKPLKQAIAIAYAVERTKKKKKKKRKKKKKKGRR